ncbi:hypothetical protein FVEN_g7741 [Fusarium venenatum]|nr:hypothetical protein FVEN_g7741 [Fusarium venenatum]
MAQAGSHDVQGPLRNVSLRVSQVFSACSFCKSRKIKCDGATPACDRCVRSGRQDTCSLQDDTSNRGRDYHTFLLQKIANAKQRLDEAQTGQDGPSSLPSRPQAQESSMIDSLVNDIEALPIIQCSYASATGGPTLSTLVLATAGTDQISSSTLHEAQQNEMTPCLPKESTALSLAKHYFDNVYPRLPFFSIQGFWVQFQHVFSGASASVQNGDTHHPPNPISILSPSVEDFDSSSLSHGYSYFTVLLVLAISASSLSRSADSVISAQAERLFRNALAFRESAIIPSSIIGVQSILFLIQFATLNPSLLDAWYLIGVGMRMCVDLGLHQDPQPPDSIEVSLLETRRRLWWSVYAFDRSMSLGCGRPTELSDSAISVSLPTFRIEIPATPVEIHGRRYACRTRDTHEAFPQVEKVERSKLPATHEDSTGKRMADGPHAFTETMQVTSRQNNGRAQRAMAFRNRIYWPLSPLSGNEFHILCSGRVRKGVLDRSHGPLQFLESSCKAR